MLEPKKHNNLEWNTIMLKYCLVDLNLSIWVDLQWPVHWSWFVDLSHYLTDWLIRLILRNKYLLGEEQTKLEIKFWELSQEIYSEVNEIWNILLSLLWTDTANLTLNFARCTSASQLSESSSVPMHLEILRIRIWEKCFGNAEAIRAETFLFPWGSVLN